MLEIQELKHGSSGIWRGDVDQGCRNGGSWLRGVVCSRHYAWVPSFFATSMLHVVQATRMRKSVGTRAEALVNEHKHTCPPMLSGLRALGRWHANHFGLLALCAAWAEVELLLSR